MCVLNYQIKFGWESNPHILSSPGHWCTLREIVSKERINHKFGRKTIRGNGGFLNPHQNRPECRIVSACFPVRKMPTRFGRLRLTGSNFVIRQRVARSCCKTETTIRNWPIFCGKISESQGRTGRLALRSPLVLLSSHQQVGGNRFYFQEFVSFSFCVGGWSTKII